MTSSKSILLFVVLMNFLISCNEAGREPANKNSKQENTNQGSGLDKSAENSGSDKQGSMSDEDRNYGSYRVQLNLPGTVIEPDLLLKFLPGQIAGTKRSEPNKGTIFGETGDVTTVSYSYSFKKGGIVIVLTDYGKRDNIPSYEIKYFDIQPADPTREVELIMDEIGKGYILWDSELRNGTLYYLLANRFIIQIDAYTLPGGSDIISFFDRIDKQGLINKAKK